ncbi:MULTISPECIES: ATP-binding protein [Alicyclobacillus]|uniref:histidine kinase n=2 Tax=Alicyclobacillus TaxID=29330 RepID=T0BM16_ALIAG|nr:MULTISPECIES: ATP-binding protein [Alicyclobacillus]EPZ41809.1 hypothetical protein N007_16600 [Alicyclobacillus acidoterrestris ATCC 49025]UNO49573.1 ATP-binding protein [Alicyclobacillus acidoterrestris]
MKYRQTKLTQPPNEKGFGTEKDKTPVFRNQLTSSEILQKLNFYSEVLDIVKFFSQKLIGLLKGVPIVVAFSDAQGYLLELFGDPLVHQMVAQSGIKRGIQFIEQECGPNVVSRALQEDRPVKLIGDDHAYEALHGVACYGAVIHNMDKSLPIGTLSIMAPIGEAHDYFLPLLVTAVDSIERQLLLAHNNRTLDVLNRMILESTPNAVVIVNEKGIVRECNNLFEAYLGIRSEDIIGRPAATIPYVGEYLDRSVRGQTRYQDVELNIPKPEESAARICLFDCYPILDTSKCPSGALGQLKDITERSRTEQLLIQAEKMSVAGQLGAAFAHEVRNPLMVLKGFFQLISEEYSVKSDYVNIMMDEFRGIEEIVQEFLSVSRPRGSTYRKCDIGCVLTSTVSLISPMTRMKGITISTDIAKDDLFVLGDEHNIKQIIINLLNNAMDAMEHPGSIYVSAKLNDTKTNVQIEIQDEGAGIDPNIFSKLGTPFYTTKEKGTGLGLTVCSILIEQHNGTIHFRNRNEGGTSVILEFPAFQSKATESNRDDDKVS